MLTENQLHRILEKAIRAPSGDNCQPWTFEWDGKTLRIFHDAQRAKHPLSPGGISSVITLGCLLESIELAASELRYKITWKFQPFKEAGVCLWAEVSFVSGEVEKNPLSEMLLKRSTDRRSFQGGDLNPQMFQKIDLSPARLHILSKPSEEIINYLVEAEQLFVEHPEILPVTMRWVRFSGSHVRKTGDGISWQGLGARVWELPLMPILRDFPSTLRIAKYVVGPQHRARVDQQLRSSAGLVCVSAPTQNPEDFVTSGRLMMNAWLSLTGQGYGVQPLTITSAIGMCVNAGIVQLPEKWIRLFNRGDGLLRRSFSIPSGSAPIWMIRTGVSAPLPDKSKTLRKPIKDIMSFKTYSD